MYSVKCEGRVTAHSVWMHIQDVHSRWWRDCILRLEAESQYPWLRGEAMMSSREARRKAATSFALATGGVIMHLPGAGDSVMDRILYPSLCSIALVLAVSQGSSFTLMPPSTRHGCHLVDHWLVELSLCCNSALILVFAAEFLINTILNYSENWKWEKQFPLFRVL